MRRTVLAIPKEEVEAHFAENSRQDLKLVNAEILSYDLFKVLKAKGKDLKMEERLGAAVWGHSGPEQPNKVCTAGEFADLQLPQYAHGPFGISMASANSIQDEHYHKQHLEICVCLGAITMEYRAVEETRCESITMPNGGIFVITPNVVHKLSPSALIVLIELPSLARDKFDAKLREA